MATTKFKLRSLNNGFPAVNAGGDNTGQKNPSEAPDTAPNKASFIQVLGSVLAGAAGVQSRKNRERDFSQSSFLPYIIGGIIFTVAFVGGLALLVNILLNQPSN